MSSQYTRDELLYLARLAEQCDRFDGKCLSTSCSVKHDDVIEGQWLGVCCIRYVLRDMHQEAGSDSNHHT